MENTNPTMPPPPNPYQQGNPYQQQGPGGYQGYNQVPGGMQTDAPGAGTAQVCGIIGLILFFNLIGLILNIIAITNGNKAIREYTTYPGRYTEASFRKAKAGRTCGIVGLSLLGGLIVIVLLFAAAFA
jgi:hypothetical protein